MAGGGIGCDGDGGGGGGGEVIGWRGDGDARTTGVQGDVDGGAGTACIKAVGIGCVDGTVIGHVRCEVLYGDAGGGA